MVISAVGKKEKEFVAKLTLKELYRYTPGQGINKVWYDKQVFEITTEQSPGVITKVRTQNARDGNINMMLTASAVNPDPLSRKYQEDIDKEMTRLNIVQDKLPDNQEPNKLKGDLRHQLHVGFVDDPGMDEIDSVRKNMQRYRTVTVNQAHYKRIESHMNRYRNLYGNSANVQAEPRFLTKKEERDPYSGMNEYTGLVAEW